MTTRKEHWAGLTASEVPSELRRLAGLNTIGRDAWPALLRAAEVIEQQAQEIERLEEHLDHESRIR